MQSIFANMDGIEEKVERYYFDEMIYILLIFSSDLAVYNDDQIVCFAEDIEGTIDTVFDKELLLQLNPKFGVSPEMVGNFESIRHEIEALYEPKWSRKLRQPAEIKKIKMLATTLLNELGIPFSEPVSYGETHLEVDWT